MNLALLYTREDAKPPSLMGIDAIEIPSGVGTDADCDTVEILVWIEQLPAEEAAYVLSAMPFGDVRHLLHLMHEHGFQRHAMDIRKALALDTANQESMSMDYMKSGVAAHVKTRIGWIVGLSMMGFLTGMIIQKFEDALSALVILAFYIPVMGDTGGNVGSQAGVMIVRCLATGEVSLHQWREILWKELRVSLVMAGILMGVVMARVLLTGNGYSLPAGISLSMIGVSVSIAMAAQVVTSTLMGSILPFAARLLRQDPAVLVSPLLTSVSDITGMLIYFYTATWILGLH
ncbi:Magnesium transporter MgtE [BD1-7 clade bacterium]|uniref:Magnesium transporter MgtE n=1 Tax=BD1-7 clade bacterium TaxID=2029982 RepID=A0A5S9N459_9GAMM|nr:Magnesium transporter MgtE [BD1-7 clade bacterium]CAA0084568.1 Magnesium transporter MgtE [BD1-7 clade bacterium]